MDDPELLAAWRAGDANSGRLLVDRHFPSLYRFFRNKVGDEADDLVQETFLAILRSTVPFRGEASFRTYLFQAARHRLVDRARRWRGSEVDTSVTSIADLRPGLGTQLGQRREERLLLAALRRLSIDQQTLLALHFFEGMSGPELAEVFEVAEGTIRSRLRLGREALKVALEALAGDAATLHSTLTGLDAWAQAAGERLRKDG